MLRAHPMTSAYGPTARAATCVLSTMLACLALCTSIAFGAPLPGWPAGAKLERVRFRGLADGAEASAKKAFDVPEGGVPDSSRVEAGVVRLVSALQSDGFLEARVDSIAALGEGELVVHVTTGVRYRIGTVTWDGLAAMSAGEAEATSGIVSGRPFRPNELARGLDRLLETYELRALPDARANVTNVEPKDGEVKIALRVFEGDSLVVKDVAFEGARTTKRGVLEKCVRDVVGQPYNPARLEAARRRIAELGVFRRVGEPRVGTLGEERGIVTFPLEEAAASSFDGAIGFQGEGGSVTGLADLQLGNLGGSARRAALRWEGRGNGVTEFRGGYTEPMLFGLGLRGDADFAQHVEDTLYTRSRGAIRTDAGARA